MDVVCLEQGDWPDRADYPGPRPDWELAGAEAVVAGPERRAAARPTTRSTSPTSDIAPLMYNGVGGSTVLYAGDWPRLHAVRLPRPHARRRRRRLAPHVRGARAVLRPHRPRRSASSGLAGDPAYPAGADLPLPPLPLGAPGAEGRARARPARLALVAGAERDPPRPTRAATRARSWGSCMQGCPEGAKASTDVTHWPQAIARGARAASPARASRALRRRRDGLVTGAGTSTRTAREHAPRRDVVVLAANAIGTPRLLLLSASRRSRTASRTRSGLVGRRLMMHPFARRDRRLRRVARDLAGHVGSRIHSLRVLRDRRAPRVRARREVEPRAVDRRPDERRDACPRRRGGLGR